MAPATHVQVAGVLLIGFEKRSTPDVAEKIAAEAGYNSSPFFGAAKARARLLSELVMVNAALMIVAVNQAFDLPDAKAIIDLFLAGARESVFALIERRDATFKVRYEKRLAEYFQAVVERNPGVAVSFCFIRNLGLDPLKRVDAQVSVAKRLGETLSSTIAMLKTMQIVRAPQ